MIMSRNWREGAHYLIKVWEVTRNNFNAIFYANKLMFFKHHLLSSQQWKDIVFTTYGIFTLANFIIANLTCANVISQVTLSWGMATTIVVHAKVVSYCDRCFEDDFILLVVEIFGCLHQQMNNFLHQFVNITWSAKSSRAFFSILCPFYK
jgi:hypothetical protein